MFFCGYLSFHSVTVTANMYNRSTKMALEESEIEKQRTVLNVHAVALVIWREQGIAFDAVCIAGKRCHTPHVTQ